MSGPYRDAERHPTGEAPRDEGIVGDVIAQFADPFAFYRELVQNAIDAGTPTVEVALAYDRDASRMRVAVTDRGEGMTRDIVENQLLVLFRSTKEHDRTKIGKFGIGFASVLAPEPEVVVVSTARDGRRITLHLYRDLHYELFDAGHATRTGTTIELELAMPPERVAGFAEASEAALVRWCRHATVPIELLIEVGDEPVRRRIDRPLAIEDALVEVRQTTDGGQLTAVVALTTGAAYTGFFNHGLMLFETADPLVGQLAVKLQDARLGHTLSRDDVRRDEYFDRALGFARELAHTELAAAVAERIRAHADRGELSEHTRLVAAVARAALAIPALHLPLVEPLGDRRSVDARELGRRAWASRRSTPLTAALAAIGTPTLHQGAVEACGELLGRGFGCIVHDAERELTSAIPVDVAAADQALVEELVHVFDRVHRTPRSVVLVELAGARADRLAIAGVGKGRAQVVERDEAARDPFALLQRRPLLLSASHPIVAAARTSADPRLAATYVARAVLLQFELLDVARSHAILVHALARVGATR